MITIVAKNFIGGVWHEGQLDLTTYNPAKLSEVAGQAHSASAEDIAYAVKVAKKSLAKLRSLGPANRADLVYALLQPMRRYAAELAKYLTHECGFTLKESREEVLEAIRYCQFVAGQGAATVARQAAWLPASRETRFVRKPVGVAVCLPGWREPFAGALKLALPSVMAGNAVIVKASEHAIAISQWLARLILESGLGEGFLSVVHGKDDAVGDLLVGEPDVQVLAGDFGPEHLARLREATCARPGVRLLPEPYGLNAVAVFEDADLDRAAAVAFAGAFKKAGQLRTSTKVAFVAEPLVEAFASKIAGLVKQARVGDGLDDATTLGPVANRESMQAFKTGLEQLKGQILCQGTVTDGSQNLFATPHVVLGDDSTPTHAFDGPFLLVKPLHSMDPLLGPMNSLSLVTQSIETVHKVREACDCNRLFVNCATTSRLAPNWDEDVADVTQTLALGIEA